MKDEKQCPICRKVFNSHNGRIYCSPDCRKAAEKIRKKNQCDQRKLQRQEKRTPKFCVVCGKEIHSDGTRRQYCSAACAHKAHYERKKNGTIQKIEIYEDPNTCIRCLRPRAEGSKLCTYHSKIEERIARKGGLEC